MRVDRRRLVHRRSQTVVRNPAVLARQPRWLTHCKTWSTRDGGV